MTLATTSNGTAATIQQWSNEQKKLIKSQIAPGCTDDELRLFAEQCRRTALDPFARQICAIKRSSYDKATGGYVEKMTIQVTIDGFRVIAQRSNEYRGQGGPWWCGTDGVWRDVWLSDQPPAAAKVTVFRDGFTEPVTGIALWNEYAQKNPKKPGQYIGLWQPGSGKPAVMLAKCAESLALRKAFPNDLSGLYSPEEMGTEPITVAAVTDVTDVTPAVAPAQPAAIAPAAAKPAPADAAAAPAPKPEPVVAEVVEEAPAAAAEPSAAPEAPAAAPVSPEVDQLRAALNKLTATGRKALLAAYKGINGFDEVTNISEFFNRASAQAAVHVRGLSEANIVKLNDGLHPTNGERLVNKPGPKPAEPAAEVPEDPANPFGGDE